MRSVTGVLAGLGVASLVSAGIGVSETSGNDTGLPRSRERRESSPSIVQQLDTTITIRASGSSLEFQPARIAVKTGLNVRLRFVNDGTLPHNVAMPRSDDDLDAIAVAAYQAGETGYIPPAHKDKLIVYTTLASPGQTVEATFVVPPPGEYTYVCLFPGHANSMLGTLRALK